MPIEAISPVGDDGPPPSRYLLGHPKQVWPREADHLQPWLIANLDALAQCLGLERLEFVGRNVAVGEQRFGRDAQDVVRPTAGIRLDILARDERGRPVAIEAQHGVGDHAHLGKLLTYAHRVQAAVAVWVATDDEPLYNESVFTGDHLATLAELNRVFVGRREFHPVQVTVESERRPYDEDIRGVPLFPQLRRVNPITAKLGPAVAAAPPLDPAS